MNITNCCYLCVLCIALCSTPGYTKDNRYSQILTVVKQVDINFNTNNKYDGNKNICIIENPHTGNYLLGFHRDIDLYGAYGKYRTNIEFIELNNNLEEQYKYKPLVKLQNAYKNPKMQPNRFSTAQDPRLIKLKDKSLMIYNDSISADNLRRVYIASLNISNQYVKLEEISPITYAPGKDKDQKNWSPFVYDDKLHLIYTVDPYIVLEWDHEKKKISTTYKTPTTAQTKWSFGIIRGGTPAIYIKDFDAYLTFFHSSLEYKANAPECKDRRGPPWRIYYVGALLIDNKPPFTIKAITVSPLTFAGLYQETDVNYHILFPTGIVESGSDILISAGYQDSKALILKVSKVELYNNFTFFAQNIKN